LLLEEKKLHDHIQTLVSKETEEIPQRADLVRAKHEILEKLVSDKERAYQGCLKLEEEINQINENKRLLLEEGRQMSIKEMGLLLSEE